MPASDKERPAMISKRTVFLWLLGGAVSVLAAPWANADAPSETVDVSALVDKLTLLSDGKGHYVAVTPMPADQRELFYGDGKTFFQVPLVGASRNGDKWEHAFAEPRLTEGNRGEGSGYVGFDGQSYRVECGKRVTPLTPVAAAESKTILGSGKFVVSPRKFRPYALSRDDRGTYYYVDRGYHDKDRARFRVFIGQKGNLKPQQMTNVVNDPSGDIFSTKTGTLRLVLNKDPQELKWVFGKKSSPLVRVSLDINTMIASIYNEFGVYSGERLGTPCDDL